MIKKITIVLIILSIIFASACSSTSNSNDISNRNIVFISKVKNDEYWNVVRMGAEAAATEFNVKIELLATDFKEDVAGQIQLVEKALTKKTDAIVIAVNDYDGLVEVIEKAHNRKVPTIIIDSEVNTEKVSSFIGTNNYEAGRMAGSTLINTIGSKGNVAVLSFLKSSEKGEKREAGLIDFLSSYSNIKVVAKEYSLLDITIARLLAKEIILNNPDLQAIVALNSTLTEGAGEVIQEMGLKDKISIIGFDSTLKEIELLEKGIIKGIIVQNPFSIGYLGVKNAVLALKGEAVPKNLDTGITAIDKHNMYDPKNQKLLFPFVK